MAKIFCGFGVETGFWIRGNRQMVSISSEGTKTRGETDVLKGDASLPIPQAEDVSFLAEVRIAYSFQHLPLLRPT